MAETGLTQIIEGALMAAGEPLSVQRIAQLFEEHERPGNDDIRTALAEVSERCEGHGFELIEVASGWRFQVRQNLAGWVSRLWQERPVRYSRALLETLSLIAYRQPITRGEIEEIRGVAVSSNIIKTLQEREWVRVVGHRDVPGRPAMYATTRQFLDYFNLKSLEDLPPLAEIRELDNLSGNLLAAEGEAADAGAETAGAAAANDDSGQGQEPAAQQEKQEQQEQASEEGLAAESEGQQAAPDASAADTLADETVTDESVTGDSVDQAAATDNEAIEAADNGQPVAAVDADEAKDNPVPASTGSEGEAEHSLGAEDIGGQQETEPEDRD